MAVLIVVTQVQAGDTTLQNAEPKDTAASKQKVEEPLGLENPGSIVERLKRDEEAKDHLLQFPGVAGAMICSILKNYQNLISQLEVKLEYWF